MKQTYIKLRREKYLSGVMVLLLAIVGTVVPAKPANAAMLTERSLLISSSANGTINVGTEGTGGNGARARHTVGFKPTSTAVGSMIVMYCDSPIHGSTCTTPTGLTVTNVTSVTETFPAAWSLDTTTNNTAVTGCNGGASTTRVNCLFVKAAANDTLVAGTAYTVAYGGAAGSYVVNPTTDNYTFFARVYMFAGTTFGGGSPTNPVTANADYGAVASSTADQIDITSIVKETLTFSVGATYVAPGGSCAALTNAGIALGDVDGVLSTGAAYDKHSWFRVHTNGLNGTVVQYSAPTLTSGSYTITGLAAETASDWGAEQFGLAYNDTEANIVAEGLPGDLIADTDYDEGDGTIVDPGGTARFNFNTGSVTTPDTIASTGGIGSGIVDCDTMAIRYIGNISTTTEAGIYTTTVTYIATPTF